MNTTFSYIGPPIDDREILERLPESLQQFLLQHNGCIMFDGALHIRGACNSPTRHSLRNAWHGNSAFHKLYALLEIDDVPFAQDCVGDQFLLRNNLVITLHAEDGSISEMNCSFQQFLTAAGATPLEFLGAHPLEGYKKTGNVLAPGQLLFAYPPFCTLEASAGVHLSAVSAEEVIAAHAKFAAMISRLKDGKKFKLKIKK